MFKKILDAIKMSEENIIKNVTERVNQNITYRISTIETRQVSVIKELSENLRNQSELFEQLANNKFEEDNTRYDTVVLIPYRGKPFVYKDGQRINTDKASSFNVNWATGSKTEVNVYNE